MHRGQRGPRREPTGAPTASQRAQPRPAASFSSPDTTRRTRPPSRSLILENTILSKMGVACRGRLGQHRQRDRSRCGAGTEVAFMSARLPRMGAACRWRLGEQSWPHTSQRHVQGAAHTHKQGRCHAVCCSAPAPCSSCSSTAGMDAYLHPWPAHGHHTWTPCTWGRHKKDAYLHHMPAHLVVRVALGQHVQLAAVAPVEQRLLQEGALRHLARQGAVDTRQQQVSAGVLAGADNGAQHGAESCSGWAPPPPGHAKLDAGRLAIECAGAQLSAAAPRQEAPQSQASRAPTFCIMPEQMRTHGRHLYNQGANDAKPNSNDSCPPSA